MNSTTCLILVLAIVANGAAASLPSILLSNGIPFIIKCNPPSNVIINNANLGTVSGVVLLGTDSGVVLDLTAPQHCSIDEQDSMNRKSTAETEAFLVPFNNVVFENVTAMVLMAAGDEVLAAWR